MLRVLALLGLFLLPMQMRAGTEHVHPHALLHLLMDAADSEIDHHANEEAQGHGQSDHSGHPLRREAASPDFPTFESIQMAAGGLAVTLVTIVFLLMPSTRERVWPRREAWIGRRLRPELPPPRLMTP
jgi:hypothetical protein